MAFPDPPTETALAAWLGFDRSVLLPVRALMRPDDDFGNVPRQGITFTPQGLEKIKSAFPVPWEEALARPDAQKKNGATPEPAIEPERETCTLIVRQRSGNNRSVLCSPEAFPHARLWVLPTARQKASTLRPGMVLAGCYRTFPGNPTIFTYDGPVPLRFGLPMPALPKKEGAPAA